MVLFVDKYKPKTLNKFHIHKDISKKLINLGQNKDISNIIFYGLSGSGKTTLVNAFIKHYFNKEIISKKYSFQIEKKNIEYRRSNYHYEIIVKKKNYVLYHNIEILVKHIIKNLNKRKQQIIFIKNFGELTQEKQNIFKTIFEKTSKYCKFILTTSSIGKIEKAIRSRLLQIRVPQPTYDELTTFVKKICKKESLQFKKTYLKKIFKVSERNIYKCLLVLQLSYTEDGFVEYKDRINIEIKKVCKLVKSKRENKFLKIRDQLLFLIKLNVSISNIITETIKYFSKIEDEKKIEIIHLAAETDHRISLGHKYLYHLEYFFFNLIKILSSTTLKK